MTKHMEDVILCIFSNCLEGEEAFYAVGEGMRGRGIFLKFFVGEEIFLPIFIEREDSSFLNFVICLLV